MPETLQGLFGFALIAGLFIWYVRERRARTRAAAPPDSIAKPPAERPATEMEPVEAPVTQGSSPNWGAPIGFCLLLLGAVTHRGNFWGYLWQACYLGIVVVATYSTFSPKELAAEKLRRPGTTRREHYVKLGVPYILVPVVAWTIAIPLRVNGAWMLPALPWALLLAAGVVLSLTGRKSIG